MDDLYGIETNVAWVCERIAAAAQRAGRRPDEITLVAITKTCAAPVVAAAYRAGLREFGENRVEEASAKIPGFQELIPTPEPLRWHMVGHLQRRKARLATELFDLIHSVDGLRLAQRINRDSAEIGKVIPVLLEINVSGEVSKHGFNLSPLAGSQAKASFIADVEQILMLPYLRLCGLMTMAPIVTDPEEARPVFAALRTLRDELSQRFPEADWRELSMGMTADYEVAVEEGATMVRVGRGVFGERNKAV
jgi:pyridoxal phosphate enzyme (YggS family)